MWPAPVQGPNRIIVTDEFAFVLFSFNLVRCSSVVPLLCYFIAECGHDEGGIIVGHELPLTTSFSVLNVILLAEPLTVLRAMGNGKTKRNL